MINLLPHDTKSSYIYAKRNVYLRRWLTILVISLAILGIIGTIGLISIQQTTAHYNEQIRISQKALTDKKLIDTQNKIKDVSSSFKLVVKVLKQEVLFSQLLKQIASTIPPNANLTSLNIIQTSGGIDISAEAKDYATATQVQVNLADPSNKIFSKADLVNIDCKNDDANASESIYPCTVTVRALFSPNNPYLFINNKGVKQ